MPGGSFSTNLVFILYKEQYTAAPGYDLNVKNALNMSNNLADSRMSY